MKAYGKIICTLAVSLFCFAAVGAALGQAADEFKETDVMIPMRDGLKMQTVIFSPVAATAALPILLTRTPYGVPEEPG